MTIKKSAALENTTPQQISFDLLRDFGLSESEAKVYVYLLERGTEVRGSKIAEATGLHRQYVYLSLEKLIALGLVEAIPYGKQHKYTARPPTVIEKIAKKRMLAASDLVAELHKFSTIGHEQDFEVVQGDRAIREYEFNYAENTTDEEELIIGGSSDGFVRTMGAHLDEYLQIKRANHVRVKYIGSSQELESYKKYLGIFPNQEYRFMEQLPPGGAHVVVRKESVSFYSFLNPPLVYVLKSPVVAESYKKFFMMLWNLAGVEK